MSKEIDQRVVEMRFDNKQFEANVQTSISTLDKLKKSLRLDGAVKGLDTVDKAAKKVDMSSLSKSAETVRAKFSALEVMGVTALANITNSAVNAGKKLVKSLTIDPIMDGFQEYEMTLNAVQTTMAGTGKTAAEVEKELKKLDEYADKTVYSTADMLNNLPKFTNAGVELEKATTAMIGIANATALAGGDADKASIAFYNLGQAIGTGYLTRMDYNSINNAGIATMEWKEQMIEAAIAQGTLTKVGEDSYKAGKKTYTLQQLFIDGLQEQWATTDVMMKVFGDYGDTTTEIGKKAQSAAQDIKTFSQMMESLKATAGTGWKDTWQLIFGGLDEAKVFWTGLSDFISGIINRMADFRNGVLEGALGKTFKGLSKSLDGILTPAKKAAGTVEKVANTVKDLGEVVDEVILGKFGNGEKRVKALTEAGYNFAEVQNKVNEKLGNSYRYTVKLDEAQKDQNGTQKKLNKSNAKLIEDLCDMSDAELESLGYTKEQIDAFRELKKEADKLGISVSEFVENIDELNGRTILITSFKNIGKAIGDVFGAIKEAFTDIFDLPSISDISQKLYDLIAGFHNLTMKMQLNEGTADKITRTFRGLFAAIDLIYTVVGGPIRIAFKLLMKILEAFDLDILDITAAIGDAIVKFHDWIDSVLDFKEIFKNIGSVLSDGLEVVRDWISEFKDRGIEIGSSLMEGIKEGLSGWSFNIWDTIVNICNNIIQWFAKVLQINSPSKRTMPFGSGLIEGIIEGLKLAWGKLLDFIGGIADSITDAFGKINFRALAAGITAAITFIPKLKFLAPLGALASLGFALGEDTISGLLKGIKEGGHSVLDFISNLASNIISTICDILGIASPSKVMMTIGGFIVAGLVAGIANFDWSQLSSVLWVVSAFIPKAPILNILAALASVAASMGMNIVDGLGKGISGAAGAVFNVITTVATKVIETVKKIFGINSPSKVMMAIGGFLITGLIAGIAGDAEGVFSTFKAVLTNIVSIAKNAFLGILNFVKNIKLGHVIAIALTAGIILAIKKIFDIINSFAGLAKGFKKLCNSASGLMDAFTEKISGKTNKWKNIANNMLKMAGAIAILAAAVYLLTIPDYGKVWNAVGAITVLAIVLGGLAFAMDKLKVSGADFGKISLLIISIAGAMLMVSKAMSGLAKLSEDEVKQAGVCASGLVVFMGILMGLSRIGKVDKVGGMLLKIAGTLAILTFVLKILAGMDDFALTQALKGMLELLAFLAGMMLITKIGNYKKVGSMLLQIAGVVAILAIVLKILGGMTFDELVNAGVGLALLSAAMIAMIEISKLGNYKKVGSMLLQMAGAIAILALTARLIAGMEWSEMGTAAVGLIGLGAIIAGLIWATKLAGGGREFKDLGKTLLYVAGAIGILALIATLISIVPLPQLAIGIGAVAILGVIMAMLINVTKNAQKCVGNIISVTIALAILMTGLYLLSTVPDPNTLMAASVAISIVMGMLIAVIAVSKNLSTSIGGIVAITVAVGVLAGALYVLATIPDPNSLMAGAIALGLLMGVLLGVMWAVTKLKDPSIQSMGTLLIMTAAIAVIAGALYLLAMIPVQNALVSALSLGILMAALVGIMALIANIKGIEKANTSLLIMTGAIAILSGALYLLGMLPIQNALGAALSLGVLMLALSAAMLIISNAGGQAITGAAAILIIAAALAILTPCLIALGSMSLGQIGVGLLALAGAFTVIGLAGLLLAPIAAPIVALAAAVALIGAGCLMAGTGVLNFAMALNLFLNTAIAMAGQGPAITAGILAIITGICNAIVGSTIAITTAITSVVLAITAALISSIPAILNCLKVMINSFLDFLVSTVPKFVESGMKIIVGILEGIADNIGKVIQAGTDIVVEFIRGIGKSVPRLVDAGFKMVIDFLNGMADSIRNNTPLLIAAVDNLMDAMVNAIKSWFSRLWSKGGEAAGEVSDGVDSKSGVMDGIGKNMMQGFINGIGSKFKAIKDKAIGAVTGAVDAVKKFLGINSPSKLLTDMGGWTGQGFVNGLASMIRPVYEAGSNMAKAMNDGLCEYLGIHSPATEEIENGKNTGLGYIKGLEQMKGPVSTAGFDLGKASAFNIKRGYDETTGKLSVEFDNPAIQQVAGESGEKAGTTWLDRFKSALGGNKEENSDDKSLIEQVKDKFTGKFEDAGKESGVSFDEGLASGISSGKTAEEAAEEKAQNIKDAYEKEFSKVDRKIKSLELHHDLWLNENEELASIKEISDREFKLLNDKAWEQGNKVKKYEEKYLEFLNDSTFGADHAETITAYNEWLEAQKELSSLTKEMNTNRKDLADNLKEMTSSTVDLEYELWLAQNEDTATDAEKLIAKMNNINHDMTQQTNEVKKAEQEYMNALNADVKDEVRIKTLYNKLLETKIELAGLAKEYSEANDELLAVNEEKKYKNQNAINDYYDYLTKNKESLLAMGLTMEQIEKEASRITGYDPNFELKTNPVDSMSNMILTGAEALKAQTAAYTNAGIEVVQGFVGGMAEGVKEVASTGSPELLDAASILKNSLLAAINNEMVISPVIRPVLDMSNIQNGAGMMNGLFTDRSVLANVQAGFAGMDTSALNDISNNVSHISADLKNNTNTTSSGFAEVNARIQRLEESIRSMRIVLDTGAVAGGVNNKFSNNSTYENRGGI